MWAIYNILLVKKIVSNEAPLYLSDFVEFYVPGRTNLRSIKPNVLILKRKDTKTTCKNFGWRDFRLFAPFYGMIYLFLLDKPNSLLILKNV